MSKRNTKSLLKDEEGAVYAEFLIAFPPMLTMFLAMLQIAMMYTARLAVRHAAYSASRSAAVVLPDDPDNYEGESALPFGVMVINQDGAGYGGTDGGPFGWISGRGSGRLKAIRTAAAFPLLGFAPKAGRIMGELSLADQYSTGALSTAVAIPYTIGATAVTFPISAGSMTFRELFHKRRVVTTRVTYMFTCSVPIVSREPFEMCAGPIDMAIAAPDVLLEGAVGAIAGDIADAVSEVGFDLLRDEVLGRTEFRNGLEEMQFSGNPAFLLPFVFSGQRFVVLRAEASMPTHWAEYGPVAGTGPLGGSR